MFEQARVENLLHFLVAGEKFGDYASTLVVLLHADGESLHAAQNQPAFKRRQDRASGLLQKCQLVRLLRTRADYDSTQSVAVAVEELGGGMHDQVGTQRDGLLKIRRHEGVVHNQVNLSRTADIAYGANVSQCHERVGWRFNEHHAGLLREGSFDVADVGGVDVGKFQPEVRPHLIEQTWRAAVEIMAAHNVIAGLQGSDDCVDRGHAAGKHSRSNSTFK